MKTPNKEAKMIRNPITYRFTTCPTCGGERFIGDGPPWELCPECGGDGCILDVPDKLINDVLRG